MTNYSNGAGWERKVKLWFECEGYVVVRSAGSKSAVDLICWSFDEVVIIQCKKSNAKTKKVNIASAYKEDVAKLEATKSLKGWRKQLWLKQESNIYVYENNVQTVISVRDLNIAIKSRQKEEETMKQW